MGENLSLQNTSFEKMGGTLSVCGSLTQIISLIAEADQKI